MDVNLLAQLLRELILDNDRVSLPGMGSFIADIAPAYFSEDGKTIYPPFRRIFFRTTEIWNDEIIEKYYAEKMHLDQNSIKSELAEFFEKFRLDLNVKKNIDLPGFGKMRSTKEGSYFFVAEKGLDIYANAFGLEPISLKVLTYDPNMKLKKMNGSDGDEDEHGAIEMTGESLVSKEDMAKIEAQKKKDEEIESAAVQEMPAEVHAEEPARSVPAVPQSKPAAVNKIDDEEEDPAIMKRRKNIIIILSIVVAILVLVILILVFKESLSGFLDKQLYSPQDLEILRGAGK